MASTVFSLAAPPRPDRTAQRRRISWYVALLIVATPLLAAGWELWRWILLIVTLD